MEIRAILFDLDGVLVSTDRYHCQAWGALAKRLGIPFDEALNNRLRGVSRMESLEIILEGYRGKALDEEAKQALCEEKNNAYKKLLAKMCPQDIPEAVRRTLAVLRSRGLKLAVASSSKNAGYILQKTCLEACFDAVVGGNDIIHSKPHPEVFSKACQRVGEAPSHCLVVEDAPAGVTAAKAAGMACAGIGEAAADTRCDIHLQELWELPERLC